MRETGRFGVEAYLKKQVKGAGGEVRKQKWINAPDQLVIWPRVAGRTTKRYEAEMHMVETKAPLKKPRPAQTREHNRLRALGVTVLVLDTKDMVDIYVENNR